MPKTRRRCVEFHRDQKSSVNYAWRPSHPAADAFPRTFVLEDEPGIHWETFRTGQQRAIVIHIRGMRFDCFRFSWNTNVQYHRNAKPHPLAASPFIVRRDLRSLALCRILATHRRNSPVQFDSAISGIVVRENLRSASIVLSPRNPFSVAPTPLQAPSHPPACFPCKPLPRRSSAGLPGS